MKAKASGAPGKQYIHCKSHFTLVSLDVHIPLFAESSGEEPGQQIPPPPTPPHTQPPLTLAPPPSGCSQKNKRDRRELDVQGEKHGKRRLLFDEVADVSENLRGIKATSASVAVCLPSDGELQWEGYRSQESAAVTFPVVLQAVQDQLAGRS